jgi:DNA-directed RNA polymerase specialized sigma subunit
MSCKHYTFKLTENDRHYIISEQHNNCVLCLVEDKGPLSQEEIGMYMGVTKMRVWQIQKIAMKKLIKKIKYDSKESTIRFPGNVI